jgi:hypothetical protein
MPNAQYSKKEKAGVPMFSQQQPMRKIGPALRVHNDGKCFNGGLPCSGSMKSSMMHHNVADEK